LTVRLLVPARAELDDAVAWYEAQAPGLGDAFLIEAVRVLRLVERHPTAWQRMSENTRRCRLARFPFGIVYTIDDSGVLVIAVAHLHRAPHYWRDRLLSAGS